VVRNPIDWNILVQRIVAAPAPEKRKIIKKRIGTIKRKYSQTREYKLDLGNGREPKKMKLTLTYTAVHLIIRRGARPKEELEEEDEKEEKRARTQPSS